jgi:hypothetical protein
VTKTTTRRAGRESPAKNVSARAVPLKMASLLGGAPSKLQSAFRMALRSGEPSGVTR